MSTYEYFEFRAVDRPLTDEEMHKLRQYSTRAQITPTSFSNEYNWGNFKGDPEKWMELYFDAFVHVASWGTRWFMMRVPKRLIDAEVLAQYRVDEFFTFWTTDEHHILSFIVEEVEGYEEWEEGEGWLPSLISLRSDLLNGDMRCLYLSWLLTLQCHYLEDDDEEPPVPVGLGELTAPLQAFAAFLRIDDNIIATAAEGHEKYIQPITSQEDLVQWTRQLPPEEKNANILRLLQEDNPHLSVELRQRVESDLQEQAGLAGTSQQPLPRTAGELLQRVEIVAEKRRREKAARKAREHAERQRKEAALRKKYLETLSGSKNKLWTQVQDHIAAKNASHYDRAVNILRDLRDLAKMNKQSSDFSLKMNALYAEHARKPKLIERFKKAKL